DIDGRVSVPNASRERYGPALCVDGNPCTADLCHPTTGCTHALADCDDENPCTDDACDAAIGCTHTPAPAGTSCGGASDMVCDNPDTCDESGACLPNHEPDGTPCEDGDACTTADTCMGGV